MLDPEQHLALHHQRGGLHRHHADAVRQAREPEPVAADQPGPAVALGEHERPHPVAVLGAPRQHALGLDALDPHPVRAEPHHVADDGVLEFRHHMVGAVHVEPQQVLDPVVGVGAAAGPRAHLRDPRPDRARRRLDRDRAGGDAVGVGQQLVAGQGRGRLLFGGPPGEDLFAQGHAPSLRRVRPRGIRRNPRSGA